MDYTAIRITGAGPDSDIISIWGRYGKIASYDIANDEGRRLFYRRWRRDGSAHYDPIDPGPLTVVSWPVRDLRPVSEDND